MSQIAQAVVHRVNQLFKGVAAPDASKVSVSEPPPDAVPYVPLLDENYEWRTEIYQVLMAWLRSGKKYKERIQQGLPVRARNLFIKGPPGTGKSSAVEQLLARLRLPLYRIACHDRLEMDALVGLFMLSTAVPASAAVAQGVEMTAVQAARASGKGLLSTVLSSAFDRLVAAVSGLAYSAPKMAFCYGALARAMKEGAVLMLDEADALPPETWAALHTVLDGGPLVIPQTGEIIYPHPSFRIVATGNVGFHGDETGAHRGIKRQNVATSRRFIFMLVNYMPEDEEVELVKRVVPELHEDLAKHMVSFANTIRSQHVSSPNGSGTMTGVMSTDIVLRWAELTYDFTGMSIFPRPADAALEVAATNGWSSADRVSALDSWTNLVGLGSP